MALGLVDEVIDELQKESAVSANIEINWKEEYLFIHYYSQQIEMDDIEFQGKMFTIEQDLFDKKKEVFVDSLIAGIKKFSLLNISQAIKIHDLEENKIIWETKSCETFREKVFDCLRLNKLQTFEVTLPQDHTELYFYVPSNKILMENVLIINGDYNTASVNTLYAKMIEQGEQFDKISFIGKIETACSYSLKTILNFAVNKLIEKWNESLGNYKCDKNRTSEVIDLTGFDEDDFTDDEEIFYELNTSDIMEVDEPLESYYKIDIKGLCNGWDDQVNMNRYHNVKRFDDELMKNFLMNTCRDKFFENLEDKTIVIDAEVASNKPAIRNDLDGSNMLNMIKRPKALESPTVSHSQIKSNLFNDKEIEKWRKYERSDNKLKDVLSNCNSEYKDISKTLKTKIPKLKPIGPTCRRSIHQDNKESKNTEHLGYFVSCISKIQPYNSPSVFRTPDKTPESMSKFLKPNVSIAINDDDDDDDREDHHNTTNQTNESQITRRRLLNFPENKIFKYRKRSEPNFNMFKKK